MKLDPKRLFIRLTLITVFILSALRLSLFSFQFARESLQMDFSAYYTAGEALNRGLPPYRNNIVNDPPVWDGVSYFKHSRFLYPPLVATMFRPLALIPYPVAKSIWLLLTLALAAYSMKIAAGFVNLGSKTDEILMTAIFVCLYSPFLIHLECGQIDVLTLSLILCSIKLTRGNGKRKFAAGVLLSAAALFKPTCVLIFPFLILRKKWKVVYGYVAGIFLILALTIIFNGVGTTKDYLFDELPRISAFGDGGGKAMELPIEAVQKYLGDVRRPMTIKNGIVYKIGVLHFTINAGLVNLLRLVIERFGVAVPRGVLSVCLFGALFALMWIKDKHLKSDSELGVADDFIYWQIVLVIILLSGPLTWVMNAVWLMPAITLVLYKARALDDEKDAINLYLCAIGLLFAAIPDHVSFPVLVPYGGLIIKQKYILAEILLLISLLRMLGKGADAYKNA